MSNAEAAKEPKQPCEQPCEDTQDLQAQTQALPEDLPPLTPAQERLMVAVHRLPEFLRDLLVMHAQDGLTYMQIAERLGMDPSSVRRELAQAYTRVRWARDLDDDDEDDDTDYEIDEYDLDEDEDDDEDEDEDEDERRN